MVFQDLTGQRYGRLVAIERAPNKGRRTMWKCKCDCGNEVIVRAENLKSGNTISCGCYASEQIIKRLTKHGMTNTRLASIFNSMKQRCYNEKSYEYYLYGGRGIKVCDEWLNDCSTFFDWALKNGYRDDLTIDRIDFNGDYCPENCRWADAFTQANNTRKNIYVDYNNERHTLKEWSRIIGINYGTLYSRINRLGWSIKDAFNPELHVNQFG